MASLASKFRATGGAPNMVLGGGYFQIAAGLTASVPNIDQEFFISATTAAATRFVMRCFRNITDGGYIQFDRSRGSQAAKTTLVNDDTVGKFIFNGYWDSAARQSGYIRSWYDGVYGGGRLDLGAGAIDDFARITMLDTGSSAAITLFGSSSYLLSGADCWLPLQWRWLMARSGIHNSSVLLRAYCSAPGCRSNSFLGCISQSQ